MIFGRRLALDPFLKANPPSRHVVPAAREMAAAYQDIVPAALLELWRRKGLGFYGAYQLALIDPRQWQPILDRWIVSSPDDVRRIPIAMTPFGILLYYRKLTETDEDVVFIDPVSKETGVLTWSLKTFFNEFLCDPGSIEALVSIDRLNVAYKECGPLAPGEIYEVDQMLLTMQLLKIGKANALELHKRLRDAVDPPVPTAAPPENLADAIPAAFLPTFEDYPADDPLHGLYLSSYIDWHRLLCLRPDGEYHLLFWRIHHQTFERIEVRYYSGQYALSKTDDGDDIVTLDIVLRQDSLGSDANDQELIVIRSGGTALLLRTEDMEEAASAMMRHNRLGRSDHYFFRTTLRSPFVEEPSDGREALPEADLPGGMRALISR